MYGTRKKSFKWYSAALVPQYGKLNFFIFAARTPVWSLTLLNNQEGIAFHRVSISSCPFYVSLFHFRIQAEVNQRSYTTRSSYKSFSFVLTLTWKFNVLTMEGTFSFFFFLSLLVSFFITLFFFRVTWQQFRGHEAQKESAFAQEESSHHGFLRQ